MNVIIANKYQALLSSLDIDVIKNIQGEFSVDELISQFANFYYNKMIIDITAIRNYQDINVIQNLSVNFDTSKIILSNVLGFSFTYSLTVLTAILLANSLGKQKTPVEIVGKAIVLIFFSFAMSRHDL